MKSGLGNVLCQLRRVMVRHSDGGLEDAQLLQRFARQGDEAAFEVLVWRHGPMVLGVGQRVLHNRHDAEDVLQATFLALVRQACSIQRGDTLAGWLYKVAYRTALRARERRAKLLPGQVVVEELPARPPEGTDWDTIRILDEELQRLPEKYRSPLVLSYLQGLTNEEIATQMGCPIGTVFTRLARGRGLLRKRLTRRGVTVSAGLLSVGLIPYASAGLPSGLVHTSIQVTRRFAAGSGLGVLSPNVVALSEGMGRMMCLSRPRLLGSVLVLLTVMVSGAGLLGLRGSAREQEKSSARIEKADQATGRSGEVGTAQESRERPWSEIALKEALERARSLPPSTQKVWTLLDIVRAHALAERHDEAAAAFRHAVRAALETECDHRLVEAAECAIQLGDAAAAEQIQDGLDDPSQRNWGLLQMSKAHAGRAEWETARALADRIRGIDTWRNEALAVLAGAQVKAGDFRAARSTVENLGGTSKALTLTAIALRQLRSNDPSARQTLQEAVLVAHGKAGAADPWTLATIAGAQAEAGMLDDARQTANALQQLESGNQAWQKVAIAQVMRGDVPGARRTAEQIRNETLQAQTLVQVVAGLMKGNELKQAMELADKIKLSQWRGYAWLEVGKAHARAGQRGQAALAMRRALHEAEQTEVTEANGYVGLYLRAHVAKAQAAAGLANEARAWIATTASDLVKATALLALGKGLAQPRRALEPLRVGYQYESDDEPFVGKVRLMSATPDAEEVELRSMLEKRKKLQDKPAFAQWGFGANATFRGKLVLFSCARFRDPVGALILSMAPDASAFEVVLELEKGQDIEAGRVSLDGKRLAYSVRPAKDAPAEIWVLEANGRHRKVGTNGFVQAWSPDGEKLACWRGEGNYHWQNFLLDVATGREERLAIPESDIVNDWSPDGHWLAVMAGSPDKTFAHPTKGTYPLRRIYLLRPDGSGRRELRVGTLPVDNIGARFSPDGKKLVWHQRSHQGIKVLHAVAIHTLDANEPAREVFQFDSFFRGNKQFKSNGFPCWSPDGKQTVWYVPRELLEESTTMPELVFVPNAAEAARRLSLRDKGLRWVGGFDWR